ncbi:hypothetical protein Rhow_001910 [Rhodococcus wratislaviensis]|uniref:Uncharacterized protein n=1 Tax=Rhodococcus wratislaviensis TaxID=44752 RepID=A0A402BYW9_RHOWR|nr:hypothetical protein Rhow_001910 [Rhodococcus wratislaviensis]
MHRDHESTALTSVRSSSNTSRSWSLRAVPVTRDSMWRCGSWCTRPPTAHSAGRHAGEVFEVVGTVLYGLGT